ncbi:MULTISPECIES: helix-turn-helix domain-containing protein [Bacteria]|uniref:helix-turn-helix domain-containing protein n=1 Tax=Bacteria TaxID=2 RepID=UPI0012B18448|nr:MULTISPECIES: helix-turn-helix transcriptional regulator [Bacteria]MRY42888.1 helix-turn-helix domain-containing protein [Parabacteroides distasonis]MZK53328.1 helix-turn-helix domain-containing protein [Clostridium beijerinckii]MZK61433.1 helix-turn-helix domain-containing protein [Clostridium beijerinckii]MZK71675.1 helix-turn-helix domain-containing protein [Clostridium beijerinckii]MZK77068.1 helix-turn-helix domain-containing protein [Clostridium beijerinckii]
MENLRSVRESKGIRRNFVAEKLKICPDHLSRIERGDAQTKLVQIKKFADIYNMPFSKMAEIALATYERRE